VKADLLAPIVIHASAGKPVSRCGKILPLLSYPRAHKPTKKL
jgi:hypothetical protein